MQRNPKITAINRKSLSVPVRWLLQNNFLSKNEKILNYGCGHNFDTVFLNNQGYNITGYDKYFEQFSDESLLEKTYNTTICIYVLNTIMSLEQHKGVIETINKISVNNFFAVRSDQPLFNWVYQDQYKGYLTKTTFQRLYRKQLLDQLIPNNIILHEEKGYILFKIC